MGKRELNFTRENKIPGRAYHLKPEEKALRIGVSASWLAKDRLRENPEIDYARRGHNVRYSEEE